MKWLSLNRAFYFSYCFCDFEAEKPQGHVLPEYGEKEQVIGDFAEMDALFFSFVKQEGKIFLTDNFCHFINGAKVACGQRCKRVYIMVGFAVIKVCQYISCKVNQQNA